MGRFTQTIKNRFILILLLLGFLTVSSYALSFPKANELTDNTRCYSCGMLLLHYPGPHAQVIFNKHHKQVYQYYGNLTEAMDDIIKHRPVAVYVQYMDGIGFDHFFAKNRWIKADSAYYVVDSSQYFIMGPGYFSFKNQAAAKAFLKKHGGRLLSYQQLLDRVKKKQTTYLNTRTNSMRNMNMWMFNLMPMRMDMNGFKQGRHEAVPKGYMMVPGHMQMDMLMFMGMYMTHKWAAMFMGSYNKSSMDMDMIMGSTTTKSTMKSEGFGDTQITGSWYVVNDSEQRVELRTGLSLPSGRINYRGVMAGMESSGALLYGFPMQMGSGTVDPIFGLSYTYYLPHLTLKGDFNTRQRVYKNYKDYQLGSIYRLSATASFRVLQPLSFGTTLVTQYVGKTKGWQAGPEGPQERPFWGVSYDPANSGGTTMMLFLNSQYKVNDQQRMMLQVGWPVYQNLYGIQMKRRWQISVVYGWML